MVTGFPATRSVTEPTAGLFTGTAGRSRAPADPVGLGTEVAGPFPGTTPGWPGGDGFELIAAFRKAQPTARIVAISGGGKYLQGTDCLKIARGLGANAAVMKPFKWDELQAGIDLALQTAEPHLA